jgi:hypothetical protein
MSGESGLKSEAHILLAGAKKIPCMNASSERLAVAPPAHGKPPGVAVSAEQAMKEIRGRESPSTRPNLLTNILLAETNNLLCVHR